MTRKWREVIDICNSFVSTLYMVAASGQSFLVEPIPLRLLLLHVNSEIVERTGKMEEKGRDD
jgi:hypothetical protein